MASFESVYSFEFVDYYVFALAIHPPKTDTYDADALQYLALAMCVWTYAHSIFSPLPFFCHFKPTKRSRNIMTVRAQSAVARVKCTLVK